MKCVIISEKKLFDLGKRCLSNLRDFVNNEYLLYNQVKRLRTLYFMVCQLVFSEQLKSKEYNSFVLNNIMKYQNTDYIVQPDSKEKENLLNEVWNEKIEEKYFEAKKYVIESKMGDEESEVKEVFNTPVNDKYSRMEFSLEETYEIFNMLKDELNRCHEIYEDLYYEIKDFKYIYHVYNYCYKSLDREIRLFIDQETRL